MNMAEENIANKILEPYLRHVVLVVTSILWADSSGRSTSVGMQIVSYVTGAGFHWQIMDFLKIRGALCVTIVMP